MGITEFRRYGKRPVRRQLWDAPLDGPGYGGVNLGKFRIHVAQRGLHAEIPVQLQHAFELHAPGTRCAGIFCDRKKAEFRVEAVGL